MNVSWTVLVATLAVNLWFQWRCPEDVGVPEFRWAVGVAVLALLAWVSLERKKPWRQRLIHAGMRSLALAFILLTYLLVPHLLFQHEEPAARAYPALMAPLLEQYRAEHDRYPSRLEELGPTRPPQPKLIQYQGYRVLPDGRYEFHYGKNHQRVYDSKEKTWTLPVDQD